MSCNNLDRNTFGLNPSGNVRGLQIDRNYNGVSQKNVYDAYFQASANNDQALVSNQGNNINRVVNFFFPNNDDHHLVLVSPAEVERFTYFTEVQ